MNVYFDRKVLAVDDENELYFVIGFEQIRVPSVLDVRWCCYQAYDRTL